MNVKTRHFEWSSDFNISFNRSRVLALSEGEENYLSKISFTGDFNSTYLYLAKVGHPVAQFYGVEWAGVYGYEDFDQDAAGNYTLKKGVTTNGNDRSSIQPGDIKYVDQNGDGVVNNYDRAAVGNPRTPEIQYGIPVGLSYKGFDFSMLWQGSALCSVQLSGPAVWDFPLYDQSRTGKVRKMHLNRWTPETAATATYPALHYGIHNNNKQQYSSLFLYDASYIRLKNVEIGYTLPKAWTSKAGIQSVRIYAQGQNLLTFDRLGDVDMDPEIKNGDGSWFPVQRVVNLGINMTF